jgi:hypothetical protein
MGARMTPAIDLALTGLVILGAISFLVWKLFLAQMFRARRPDVPIENLVRRKRSAASCHGDTKR